MSRDMSSKNTPNATSSQGSEDGRSTFVLPDGQMMFPFGRDHARVSPSRLRAREKARPISVTCGRNSSGSSPSAALQLSLGNRLRQRMDGLGSPEYVLTWKHWDMQSGPPICALRASVHRTSGKGCSGWPTPRVADTSNESWETKQRRNARHLAEGRNQGKGVGGMTLPMAAAQLAGWPTPKTRDWKGERTPIDGKNVSKTTGTRYGIGLEAAAKIAGWLTPQAYDATNNGKPRAMRLKKDGNRNPNKSGSWRGELKDQAAIAGAIPNTSPAQTEKRGALSPVLSGWLMGFPTVWLNHAPKKKGI